MSDDREKIARRIAALLAKAGSTEFEGERDALIEKASALQLQYVIDSTMIAAAATGSQPKVEEIISKKLCEERSTPLIKAKRELLNGIAITHRCKPLLGPARAYLLVFGYESDVQFVESLYHALIIHMQASLASEERRQILLVTKKELSAFRVSFAHAYARRVYTRLVENQQQQTVAAERVTPGAALALRDREGEVARHVRPLSAPGRAYPTNARASSAGAVAGAEAADQADLGQRRVNGGQHTALPR